MDTIFRLDINGTLQILIRAFSVSGKSAAGCKRIKNVIAGGLKFHRNPQVVTCFVEVAGIETLDCVVEVVVSGAEFELLHAQTPFANLQVRSCAIGHVGGGPGSDFRKQSLRIAETMTGEQPDSFVKGVKL